MRTQTKPVSLPQFSKKMTSLKPRSTWWEACIPSDQGALFPACATLPLYSHQATPM